jgi:hypothetical protein
MTKGKNIFNGTAPDIGFSVRVYKIPSVLTIAPLSVFFNSYFVIPVIFNNCCKAAVIKMLTNYEKFF